MAEQRPENPLNQTLGMLMNVLLYPKREQSIAINVNYRSAILVRWLGPFDHIAFIRNPYTGKLGLIPKRLKYTTLLNVRF